MVVMLWIRRFLAFALISGVGWVCDIFTFALLIELIDPQGFVANFVSSYVGVTFVWFFSLKAVFGRTGAARGGFLSAYWGFQFVSILAYSQFLNLVVGSVQISAVTAWAQVDAPFVAKFFITPFNLVTNFLFMKWLTRFMKQATPA